ncbi:MAG: divergent polysaccharide deacetylase family protein, partial [Spirochaetes bacterium]|nr:divergent polysaccharide deacetylase family protein [Spirochaetota bacterium]
VDTAKRDIFLDNEDTFSSINAQFEKLKGMAKANGTAIGIGHINKNYTIKVLNYQLPILKKENYTLIFASNAVM